MSEATGNGLMDGSEDSTILKNVSEARSNRCWLAFLTDAPNFLICIELDKQRPILNNAFNW